MPAAERSESSSFRFVAIVLVLVVAAAQEEADEESGADRDQQRLAGIGADVAPHLVGDGAEVDVVDPLAHAVVLVLHRVGGSVVLVARVVLRLVETRARCVRAAAAALRAAGGRSGGSGGGFFHGYLPGGEAYRRFAANVPYPRHGAHPPRSRQPRVRGERRIGAG